MKRKSTINSMLTVLLLFVMSSWATAQADWNYISPVPGSKYINPENNIALRHGDVIDVNSLRSDLLTVTGSERGAIAGDIKLSLDGRTLIFLPAKPFSYGETISVKVADGVKTENGLTLPEVGFSFGVKPADNSEMLSSFYLDEFNDETNLSEAGSREKSRTFITPDRSENLPDRFPTPMVTEYDSPAEGYIFCSPRPWQSAPYDPYYAILDNYGMPVFYQRWVRRANDFKMIVNNQLAYCDFDNSNTAINKYLVLNSWFEITDTLTMGNGYHVDQHDLLMRENGNYFLMAYDPQIVGMDTVVPGGDPQATVIGFVIQELDADDNVIFQWRSWDHFEITDANHTDFTDDRIDYVHGNAFEIDDDGNMLMSLRNMEEVTKIDLNTGNIIWRFGLHAKNNMFEFLNDTVGFSWQHDCRRLENGNITVYDNGNYHTPSFSQAVEYHLDEENYTAELVWNYVHDPVVYARATGANRRLANDNSFICWGLTWPINYSEVTHERELAWELHWPENVWDYRAFKFDWMTDLFEPNQDTVDFGVYEDYIPWPKIIQLTNNSDKDIEITSTHNYLDCYQVTTELPLSIPAGETVNFTFQFFPDDDEGQLDDVLTLNYDSFLYDTLPQRIARQVFLTAYVQDDNPPVASINPANGAVDVDRESLIKISFNETVAYPDGSVIKSADLKNLLIFKETDGAGADVPFTAYLDAWKRKVTIIPDDILAPGMDYYVELPGGTVADREGHVLENAVISTFTTIDDQAPMVEISPADSTTGVYINAMITYAFDEPVQTIVGSEITTEDIQAFFNLKQTDETGEDIPFIGVINDDKDLITIHPAENLDPWQYYYIELVADALMDMAGNEITEAKYSHFETGEELGIGEIRTAGMEINPNPTRDVVNITFDRDGEKAIELYNLNGRKLQSLKTRTMSASINLRPQPEGIYILKVSYNDGTMGIRKVIRN